MTNKSETRSKIKQNKETLITFAILIAALVAAFLVSGFVVSLGFIHGPSMENALYDGDIVVIWKLFDSIQAGDIVVCRLPELTAGTIVKRVAAAPGDHVLITKTGELYVNSEYITVFGKETYTPTELQLQDGEYFLLGDNLEFSTDSRDQKFGIIKDKCIEGKVIYRLFPKMTKY